jgi:hypothetical protein
MSNPRAAMARLRPRSSFYTDIKVIIGTSVLPVSYITRERKTRAKPTAENTASAKSNFLSVKSHEPQESAVIIQRYLELVLTATRQRTCTGSSQYTLIKDLT